MAILSVSEIDDYLPGAGLTDQQARIELVKAEAIATGPAGSNRQLDLSQITETISLGENEIVNLRFWPIDPTKPVTVALRNNHVDSTSWVTVPEAGFELTETGKLLIDLSMSRFDGFSRNRTTRQRRPMARRSRLEARVEYWAGYDFRADIPDGWELLPNRKTHEAVLALKSAIAQIVSLRLAAKVALTGAVGAGATTSTGAIEGREIERVEVAGAYVVQFAGAKGAAERLSAVRRVTTAAKASGSELEELLNIFRAYRARTLPT